MMMLVMTMVFMMMMVEDGDDGEHWGNKERVPGEPAAQPALTYIASKL